MIEKTNLNDRFIGRKVPAPEEDPDAFEDCGAFGFLRGVKDRALFLELRLRNGNRMAFPYALLERVSFDPSEGLFCHFMGGVVILRGRNFTRTTTSQISLLDGILRHRVPWIAEKEELHGAVQSPESVIVTKIEFAVET